MSSGPAGPQGPVGPTGVGVQGPAGVQGLAGVQGAAGLTGPAGPTGVAGPIGPAGPTGVAGMAYRGSYASTQNYGWNDAVSYRGSTYISISGSNQGNAPDASPTVWSVFAAAGVDGAAGATGAAGSPGCGGSAGACWSAGIDGSGRCGGGERCGGSPLCGGVLAGDELCPERWSGLGGIDLRFACGGQSGECSGCEFWLVGTAGAGGGCRGLLAGGSRGSRSGPTGAAGPAGATGAAGAAGQAGMVYRGAWTPGTNYQMGDAVFFAGTTYLAQMSNSASEPDLVPSAWSVLAAAGERWADRANRARWDGAGGNGNDWCRGECGDGYKYGDGYGSSVELQHSPGCDGGERDGWSWRRRSWSGNERDSVSVDVPCCVVPGDVLLGEQREFGAERVWWGGADVGAGGVYGDEVDDVLAAGELDYGDTAAGNAGRDGEHDTGVHGDDKHELYGDRKCSCGERGVSWT